MSSDTAPNTKHVNVPHPVPREPSAYRITDHFRNRARERVPAQLRDDVIRECIKFGHVSGCADPHVTEDGVEYHFQFKRQLGAEDWVLIVGIREVAFRDPDEKHVAVTVYPEETEADR